MKVLYKIDFPSIGTIEIDESQLGFYSEMAPEILFSRIKAMILEKVLFNIKIVNIEESHK